MGRRCPRACALPAQVGQHRSEVGLTAAQGVGRAWPCKGRCPRLSCSCSQHPLQGHGADSHGKLAVNACRDSRGLTTCTEPLARGGVGGGLHGFLCLQVGTQIAEVTQAEAGPGAGAFLGNPSEVPACGVPLAEQGADGLQQAFQQRSDGSLGLWGTPWL